MMEVQDFTTAMNCNFCGGVAYACDELTKFMNEKKRTTAEIKKFVKEQHDEAIKTRKNLIFSKKVIKKVSILH